MGISKHLKARLARLEARVKALPDPEAERERERVAYLHTTTWLYGGSFEDIPEKDRDPGLWETQCEWGPAILASTWEGHLPGREELLAAGVDFTRVPGVDEDDVRDHINRTSAPNPPHKP